MGFVSSKAQRGKSETRRCSPGADRGSWTGRGRGRGYFGNLCFPIFSFYCFSSFFLSFLLACMCCTERKKQEGGRFFMVPFPRTVYTLPFSLGSRSFPTARAMAGESLHPETSAPPPLLPAKQRWFSLPFYSLFLVFLGGSKSVGCETPLGEDFSLGQERISFEETLQGVSLREQPSEIQPRWHFSQCLRTSCFSYDRED